LLQLAVCDLARVLPAEHVVEADQNEERDQKVDQRETRATVAHDWTPERNTPPLQATPPVAFTTLRPALPPLVCHRGPERGKSHTCRLRVPPSCYRIDPWSHSLTYAMPARPLPSASIVRRSCPRARSATALGR